MNDQAKRDDAVAPNGAVEVSEQDLDQASGGAPIYMEQPADQDSLSAINSSLEKAAQTSVPQDPSIGLLSDPQKKL